MRELQPYIWYQYVDSAERLATQRYHVARGLDPILAQQTGARLRGLAGLISGCSIVRQEYVLPGAELLRPQPQPGHLVDLVGVFVFATISPSELAIVTVPGIKPGLVMASGPGAGLLLDVTQPDLVAFLDELLSGAWVNRFGYTLTALESAYLQVRNAVYVPWWLGR